MSGHTRWCVCVRVSSRCACENMLVYRHRSQKDTNVIHEYIQLYTNTYIYIYIYSCTYIHTCLPACLPSYLHAPLAFENAKMLGFVVPGSSKPKPANPQPQCLPLVSREWRNGYNYNYYYYYYYHSSIPY